jgi:hypothetical protein
MSFAVCHFGGQVHGHDADEMRANRLADGGVFCVFCGVRGPSTFDAFINANGVNSGKVQRIESRLDHRFTVQLKRNVAWASVVFEDPKQFDIEPGKDYGEDYVSPKPEAKLPPEIDNVAKALARVGFRVTGTHATNTMGTILMVLGAWQTPEKKFLDGVRVELSWLY